MDTKYIEKKLINLFDEFLEALNAYNKTKSPLEDKKEPTLLNFINWLNFEK